MHERLTQQNSAPKRHHRRAHCDLHWQEGTPEVRARIKTLAEMRASIIDSLLTKATTARYGAALSKTTAAELEDLPAHALGSLDPCVVPIGVLRTALWSADLGSLSVVS